MLIDIAVRTSLPKKQLSEKLQLCLKTDAYLMKARHLFVTPIFERWCIIVDNFLNYLELKL